jgi:ATP sulfurylase
MSDVEVRIQVDLDAALEIANLEHRVFAPLQGFMEEADYRSVVQTMRLADGTPWPLPVTLDVPEESLAAVRGAATIGRVNVEGTLIGELRLVPPGRRTRESLFSQFLKPNPAKQPDEMTFWLSTPGLSIFGKPDFARLISLASRIAESTPSRCVFR